MRRTTETMTSLTSGRKANLFFYIVNNLFVTNVIMQILNAHQYFSYDASKNCTTIVPGYVDKGVLTKSTEKLTCVKLEASEWNTLKLIVNEECNNCKNVNAFIDGTEVGSFEAHFTTRGFGGVLAENGFNNIAEFRNFDISPVIPKISGKMI